MSASQTAVLEGRCDLLRSLRARAYFAAGVDCVYPDRPRGEAMARFADQLASLQG